MARVSHNRPPRARAPLASRRGNITRRSPGGRYVDTKVAGNRVSFLHATKGWRTSSRDVNTNLTHTLMERFDTMERFFRSHSAFELSAKLAVLCWIAAWPIDVDAMVAYVVGLKRTWAPPRRVSRRDARIAVLLWIASQATREAA